MMESPKAADKINIQGENSPSKTMNPSANNSIQRNQNHNLSHSELSQTAQAFNEIKSNYENLIDKFSDSQLSSSNSLSLKNDHSRVSIGAISSNFLEDENAENELQQWENMWTHIVSMISQVLPNQQANLHSAKTGNEKRIILADLVSKLCENRMNPQLNEEYTKLKKKYEKSKNSFKKLKEQGDALMLEVQRNKELLNQHIDKFTINNDENSLSQKVKELEKMLRKQVKRQSRLLSLDVKSKQVPKKCKPINKFRHTVPIILPEEDDSLIIEEEEEDISEGGSYKSSDSFDEQIVKRSKKPVKQISESSEEEIVEQIQMKKQKPKIRSKKTKQVTMKKIEKHISESSSLSDEMNIKSKTIPKTQPRPKTKKVVTHSVMKKDTTTNHKSLHTANIQAENVKHKSELSEEAIQEIIEKRKQKMKKSSHMDYRLNFGHNVNQLVDVTNNLKKDYHRLKEVLGNESAGSDMSIDQLSKIHDSLLSVENQFDNISE